MDRYHQIFSDSLLTRTPVGKVRPGTQGWVYHFSPAHTLPLGFLDGYSYREGKSDTPLPQLVSSDLGGTIRDFPSAVCCG